MYLTERQQRARRDLVTCAQNLNEAVLKLDQAYDAWHTAHICNMSQEWQDELYAEYVGALGLVHMESAILIEYATIVTKGN